MYAFVPNRPFGNLLEISPTNLNFLKLFKSEHSPHKSIIYRSKYSTTRNKRQNKFNDIAIIKMCYSIEFRDWIYVKDYGFLPFSKNTRKKLDNNYN